MANFPDVIETFSHESNADISGVGGTVIDANDINAVYDLLAALETWVGPNTDTDASASHEGRLQALELLDPLTNPMTTVGDLIRGTTAGAPQRLAIGTAAQVLTVVAGVPAWAAATPLTTAGDLAYGATAGVPTRLGIGTTGQVLTVVAGLPVWAAAAGGFSDPLTTIGDLLYRNGSNVTDRLGVGAAGQYLGTTSGLPAWKTPAFIATPAGAPQGSVLYFDGSTWAYLPPGTTGQFLKTLGASTNPLWATPPSSAPGDGILDPGGETQGSILYYDGTDWQQLSPGTSGFFLKTNGASANPAWAAPASGFTNPMTILSDIIIGDTGGAAIRLPIGTNGKILTVVAGAPAWATASITAAPDYATINWMSGD